MKIKKLKKKPKLVKFSKIYAGQTFHFPDDIKNNTDPVVYMKNNVGLSICLNDGVEADFPDDVLVFPIPAVIVIDEKGYL